MRDEFQLHLWSEGFPGVLETPKLLWRKNADNNGAHFRLCAGISKKGCKTKRDIGSLTLELTLASAHPFWGEGDQLHFVGYKLTAANYINEDRSETSHTRHFDSLEEAKRAAEAYRQEFLTFCQNQLDGESVSVKEALLRRPFA